MRKIFALAIAVVLCSAGVSQAVPTVWYNAVTGNVEFQNDTANPLAVAYITSGSGKLSGTPLDIPGAETDPGDLPSALTYLNLPAGKFSAGNVVEPGTLITDIGFKYFATFGAGAQEQTGLVLPSVVIPEPATLAMAGMGLIGFIAVRRRNA
jgi:hypothetical protein